MTFTQKVKQIILLIFGLSVAGCTSLDSRTHSYDDLLSDHTGTACD